MAGGLVSAKQIHPRCVIVKQTLFTKSTLAALITSVWAPSLWKGVLFYGSRYDDYARAAITGNPTDALVFPGPTL